MIKMADDASVGLSEDDLIELSLLRDFETDALIEADLLSSDERQTQPLDREVIFKHEEADLHVTAEPQYPAGSVQWHVENRMLSRVSVISLRERLRTIVQEAEPINNLPRWKNREEVCDMGFFEPIQVVLNLATTTREQIENWRTTRPEYARQQAELQKSYLPFDTKLVSNTHLATTTNNLAYELLGRTPQEICTMLPPEYRVLHVEEIIRPNLASAFTKRRDQMRANLLTKPYQSLQVFMPPTQRNSRKEDIIEHLCRPRTTFHGTQRHFVPSIVRYGFLSPGAPNPSTHTSHTVRCGSTYGRGIYSSPSPSFSLSYTDLSCHRTSPSEYFGIKLLVCATLMGRTAQIFRSDDWRSQSHPYPGADSHVGNNEYEYIVFTPEQIIPVYVIHIDWGAENAKHFATLPDDPASYVPPKLNKTHPKLLTHVRWPADVQREKELALARARKYFPYGFGPATGNRFVIEEIGEVDDDEEVYGDYQDLRVDGKNEKDLGFWSWVKAGRAEDAAREIEEGRQFDSRADEYAREKRSNGRLTDGDEKKDRDEYAPEPWSLIPLPLEGGEGGEKDADDDDLGLGRLMMMDEE
ncbi:ADP-ribosylation [Xylariaceae sp. FL1019]|nr:ADP-ribosylation [Xylariaceae sp. FL1019]